MGPRRRRPARRRRRGRDGPGTRGCPAAQGERGIVAPHRLLLADAERAAEMATGSVAVVPVVETAAGLLETAALARGPRVARLAIGEADLAAELGVVPGPDRAELAPHRAQLVVASAAARLAGPIAPSRRT
ncbi:aldolase/citrate lyase family protein [Pseudonocardia benzenivorans]